MELDSLEGIKEYPKETRKLIVTSITILNALKKYNLKLKFEPINDKDLTIISLYLACLMNDSQLKNDLENGGIKAQHFLTFFNINSLKIEDLKKDDYERFYNDYYKDLLQNILFIYNYESEEPIKIGDFSPLIIALALHNRKLVDSEILEILLSYVYDNYKQFEISVDTCTFALNGIVADEFEIPERIEKPKTTDYKKKEVSIAKYGDFLTDKDYIINSLSLPIAGLII
jgi:hypothetical protein